MSDSPDQTKIFPAEVVQSLLQKQIDDPRAKAVQDWLTEALGKINPALEKSLRSDTGNVSAEALQPALKQLESDTALHDELISRLEPVIQDNVFNFGRIEKMVMIKSLNGEIKLGDGPVTIKTGDNTTINLGRERPPLPEQRIKLTKEQLDSIINDLQRWVMTTLILIVISVLYGLVVSPWVGINRLRQDETVLWDIAIGLTGFLIAALLFFLYQRYAGRKNGFRYVKRKFEASLPDIYEDDEAYRDADRAIMKYRKVRT